MKRHGNADIVDAGAISSFENARPRLRAMAYRMLGVMADADDVVQEVWMRWSGADRSVIRVADAWLNTVTSRLALDHLRRRKREQVGYVGPWLPEPIVSHVGDPQAAAEIADSLTLGFLIMLEELTPDERAAFLMADVFAEPSSTIAETLQRSEAACRQLASRARRKLSAARQESNANPPNASRKTIDDFLVAIVAGDETAALACLHPDVRVLSDGGANRRAARRPVVGPDRVARLMLNLAKRIDATWVIEPADVGGLPGLTFSAHGRTSGAKSDGPSDAAETVMLVAFRIVGTQIIEVFSVLNPDKLSSPDPVLGG